MTPKITFVMITARIDYPYTNREDLHVFEPTLECFKQQTMKDFEWVIVDCLYHKRPGFFKNLDLPFTVKHVPAQPNFWLKKGLTGICAQYNKGIIHADGDLIFFTGDGFMMNPDFMSNLWKHYLKGYFTLAWYFYDNTYAVMKPLEEEKEKWDLAYPKQIKAPVEYDLLGFKGEKVTVEHRYEAAFGNNTAEMVHAPWLWWFGCSSASLEAMLKINGFDQKFDGDRFLLDCDAGSRLELAGYGNYLALFRDTFLVRIPTERKQWNPDMKIDPVTIKCNSPLIWISRVRKKHKANRYALENSDIDWIKNVWCKKHCQIRELCIKEHPWQYPFEHKAGYEGHNSTHEWFEVWKNNQAVFSLEEERDKRLDGEDYLEGTFIGAS